MYVNRKSPNKAAPVAGASLTGKRTRLAKVGGSETAADRKVNTKSSDNSPKYGEQNLRGSK